MDRLAFDLELKFAGEGSPAGQIEGYASVFGLVDRGGDVVLPGAFKASLSAWKKKKSLPPMLWQHDSWQPIGVWTDLVEDEKGLKAIGQLVMDVPAAAAARALMQAGAVKGLSIGYNTEDYEVDRQTGVRRLKKVDLWEISLVTFPMLPEAQVSGVKSIDARALESTFRREFNMSSANAVKAVAIVKQHLRDAGAPPEPDDRDGFKDLLMSLRKSTEILR